MTDESHSGYPSEDDQYDDARLAELNAERLDVRRAVREPMVFWTKVLLCVAVTTLVLLVVGIAVIVGAMA